LNTTTHSYAANIGLIKDNPNTSNLNDLS